MKSKLLPLAIAMGLLCTGATIDIYLQSELAGTTDTSGSDVIPVIKAGGGSGSARKIKLGNLVPKPGDAGQAKEIWITDREVVDGGDGLNGDGTQRNPFNGGTAAKLDALIGNSGSVAANATIHIGAGTFTTSRIFVKDYWRVMGAGVDRTIIKLAANTCVTSGSGMMVIGRFDFEGFIHYAEVSGLTVNTNRENQPVYTGALNGDLSAVAIATKSGHIWNVKAVGVYAKPGEGFPVRLQHDGSSGATRRVTATTVSGANTLVATSGTFSATDLGTPALTTDATVPNSTTIATYTDSTHATMTANSTASGSKTLTVGSNDYEEIDHVEVPDPSGYMTAIMVFDQNGGYTAGSVHDCVVKDSGATSSGAQGFGGRNLRNFTFARNQAIGTDTGATIDTGDFYDVTFENNHFETNTIGDGSGSQGIIFNGSGNYDLKIKNNFIKSAQIVALLGHSDVSPASANVVITGNKLYALNATYPAISLDNSTTGIVSGNTVSETPSSAFPSTMAVTPDNVSIAGAKIWNRGLKMARADGASGSDQTCSTGARTTFNFTTVRFDPGGLMNASNDRVTAPLAGQMHISFTAYFSSITSSSFIQVEITKNGSAQVGAKTITNPNASAYSIDVVDSCVAGDYYTATVWNNTGANATLSANFQESFLNAEFIAD
jgi:hypothetical protein